MNFDDSPEEATFRAEIREKIEAVFPKREGRGGSAMALFSESDLDEGEFLKRAKAGQRKLYEAGLMQPTWPREYGGMDATPIQAYIIGQELARVDVMQAPSAIGTCGPTIISHGTDEQKKRFIPKMLSGEELWCQLWSEPNAGSDLASLQSKAERLSASGDWLINGQKVWTSMAQLADFGLMVTRTDPDVPKHRGITVFIIDMKTPGITIRPLRMMSGAAGFNEVFFDDVHVPDDRRVGDVNDGWRVATTTLMNERMMIGSIGGMFGGSIDSLVAELKNVDRNGRPAIADPVIRQELADVFIKTKLLTLTGHRTLTKISKGQIPGPEGSVMKLVATTLGWESALVGSHAVGLAGAVTDKRAPANGRFAASYVSAPGMRIAGGTDEIQRNVIGERVLGLPREPSVDRELPFRELKVGSVR